MGYSYALWLLEVLSTISKISYRDIDNEIKKAAGNNFNLEEEKKKKKRKEKQKTQSSLVAQTVKRLSTMREIRAWSLGREDPLEKEMATHSSTLAWKIPWMEEPGRLQSTGSQRVGHDWATSLHFTSDGKEGFPCGSAGKESACPWGRPGFNPWVGKIPWRRKWQPTPVLLLGKSHGRRSLVGYSPQGHKESDTTERLHLHPSCAIIFSHFEGCLFTLLTVFFVVQKLLSLIMSHLFIFAFISNIMGVGHRGSCCDLCWRVFCLCSPLGVV